MCCHLLETTEIMTDHTASNLAAGLKDALERWKLPLGKLFAAVTDNARNICVALENLNVEHIGCFTHTEGNGFARDVKSYRQSQKVGESLQSFMQIQLCSV